MKNELLDKAIRHAIYLERYKASEVKRIRKYLDDVILPDLNAKIASRIIQIKERGTDLGTATTARLKKLEREIQEFSDGLANATKLQLQKDIEPLAQAEIDWQIAAIKENLTVKIDLTQPNIGQVVQAIRTTSFAGLNLDQWFRGISHSVQRRLMIAINRGVVEGETTEEILRRIVGTRKLKFTDGIWSVTRRQAETVTRSAINHTANQARLELFKDNSDLIEGLQWVSTLDSRTSTICAGLDGKIYPVDEGPRPPAHPNCRSTMVAVLKGQERDGTRASASGQVAETTTYQDWLKRQSKDVQNEVLGATRARLFRAGMPIERFTSDRLEPLTLDQLRVLEKNAFDKAGL